MSYRVCLVGGGSGGHVYPLVAVANAVKKISNQTGSTPEILVLGEGKFIKRAAQENNLKLKTILAGKLRRYFSPLVIVDILKFPVGLAQSLWYLYWFMPDVVFAKGGYGSVAPALAAKFYFIPLYIHESDSIPGLANRILSKFARKIFITFESTSKYLNIARCEQVGNPVRSEISRADRNQALNFFQLQPDKKTLLFLGGSQGAKRINDLVIENLAVMAQKYQIIHQCGENNFDLVRVETDKIIKEGEKSYGGGVSMDYRPYAFFNLNEMAMAYVTADVIISRAGANVLSEIASVGKPVILIPLSTDSSRGEQIGNAMEMQKYGAVVIEEPNLTIHILMNQIENLLKPAAYSEISEKIKKFAKPDAADKIAQAILSAASAR